MPKLPKFEDWTPPWGEDDEKLDVETAKKLIYNLKRDVELKDTEVAEAKANATEAETQRDAAQTELATLKRGDETEIQRLQRELDEAKNRKPEVDPKVAQENLRLQVALDKGLTAFQAKRLAGTTKEELEADADELLEAFGGSGKSGTENEPEGPGKRRPEPKHNRHTGGNDDDEGGLPAYSDEALEKLIPLGG